MTDEGMDDDAFHDIANALLRLSAAFKKHGMTPPVSFELKSRQDGDRFRYYMPKNMVFAQPVMGRRDDPDICINLVGYEVRYPAQFRARERGGHDIV